MVSLYAIITAWSHTIKIVSLTFRQKWHKTWERICQYESTLACLQKVVYVTMYLYLVFIRWNQNVLNHWCALCHFAVLHVLWRNKEHTFNIVRLEWNMKLWYALTLTLPGPAAGVGGSLTVYCSIKPVCSGLGEVVPARTSPTLLPPSPCTVL